MDDDLISNDTYLWSSLPFANEVDLPTTPTPTGLTQQGKSVTPSSHPGFWSSTSYETSHSTLQTFLTSSAGSDSSSFLATLPSSRSAFTRMPALDFGPPQTGGGLYPNPEYNTSRMFAYGFSGTVGVLVIVGLVGAACALLWKRLRNAESQPAQSPELTFSALSSQETLDTMRV